MSIEEIALCSLFVGRWSWQLASVGRAVVGVSVGEWWFLVANGVQVFPSIVIISDLCIYFYPEFSFTLCIEFSFHSKVRGLEQCPIDIKHFVEPELGQDCMERTIKFIAHGKGMIIDMNVVEHCYPNNFWLIGKQATFPDPAYVIFSALNCLVDAFCHPSDDVFHNNSETKGIEANIFHDVPIRNDDDGPWESCSVVHHLDDAVDQFCWNLLHFG